MAIGEKERTIDIRKQFPEGGLYLEEKPVYSANQRYGGGVGEDGLAERSGDLLRRKENRVMMTDPVYNAQKEETLRSIRAGGAQSLRDEMSNQGRFGISGQTALRGQQDIKNQTRLNEQSASRQMLMAEDEKRRKDLEDWGTDVTKRQLAVENEERMDLQTSLIREAIASKTYAAQQSANEATAGGTCFITTACCELLFLDDNNPILNTFRKFRDEYMGGKENVSEYYKIAPLILKRMREKNEIDYLYNIISWYLLPAYREIKKGENENAEFIYTNMVHHLKGKYL